MHSTHWNSSNNRKLGMDTSKSVEKSMVFLEVPFERWCIRLRVGFFILVISSLLLFSCINLPEVTKIWSETIQSLYNTTSYNTARAASNVTLSASAIKWTSAFTAENDLFVSPSPLPREVCPPETAYSVAYPCKYNYILNEVEKCQNEKPFLVLIVPIAPKNREARDAIRATWGSEKVVLDNVVSLFFLLGQSGQKGGEELQKNILLESNVYHDIIQSDFLDSYKNLTIKTMVMMEWLATYCQNAIYAMKIDSDMFLNVYNLMNMLLEAPTIYYMTGLVFRGNVVLRNPAYKFYLPKEVFPEDVFPPYALGLGYVFSLDLPSIFIKVAKHVKAVYIEDVYVGLCMRYLGISLTSPANNNLFNVHPVPYERCRYSKLIATTTHNWQEQVNSWKDLKEYGPC